MDNAVEGAALSLHRVCVSYDGKVALENVTVEIAAGEFVGIVGPNGAGKSTLLNAVLAMVPLRGGQIRVHGLPIAQARRRVAYMPQREAVDWSFPVVVEDVVLMGRQTRLGFGRRAGAQDHAAVEQALAQMQMLDERQTPIGQLSGGQQQRVFLARALAQEGDLLLLDEPMSGVDAVTQDAILRLLQVHQRAGRTVVMTTHDLGMARAYCTKVLFVNRAAIAYGPPERTFTAAVLERTYGGHIVRVGEDGAMIADDAELGLRDKPASPGGITPEKP
jgi:ABC-type Mn2+/Zn2+ transport system ATPase subunit